MSSNRLSKLIVVILLFSAIPIYNSSARRAKDIPLDSLVEISVGKEAALNLWMDYIKNSDYISWSVVPFYVQKGLLRRMAKELGKNAGTLTAADFSRKFNFLDGRRLGALCDYYRTLRRTAIKNPEQLADPVRKIIFGRKSGILQLTAAAFISKFLENSPQESNYPISYTDMIINYISRGGKVNWDSTSFTVQRNLLERGAEEFGKPWREMLMNDFSIKLKFLNGYELAGMFQYYIRIKKAAENNSQIMPEQIKGRISSLNAEQIKSMTTADFIKFVLDSNISAAEFIITVEQKKQQLYANTGSVISLMREGKNIFWAEVPLYIQAQLLEKAIQELGIEFTQIDGKFFQQHFQFLNGRTLNGVFKYWSGKLIKDYSKLPEPFHSLITAKELKNISNRVDFVKHILGIYLTENKPICRNIQELIDLIVEKGGNINWAKIPLSLQKELLDEVADDSGYEITALDEYVLRNKSIDLLWGNTLESFYNYYDGLISKAGRDYNSLPKFYKFFITKEDAVNLAALGFIGELLDIDFDSIDPAPEAQGDYSDDVAYTEEEEQWIKGYLAIKDHHWENVVKENPSQIAFYVRELAIYIALQDGEFKDLWKLLNNRYCREMVVPCLKKPLFNMMKYFGDSYSILKYLEKRELIDIVTEEVRKRIENE